MTCQDCTAVAAATNYAKTACPACIAARRQPRIDGCLDSLNSIYASLEDDGIDLADIDDETRAEIDAIKADLAAAILS